MQINRRSSLTPCQQDIHDAISAQLALAQPTIIIINAEPGSGLSTLMECLAQDMRSVCLKLVSRPAMSELNLLETFYYHLGLGGEGISHRAPIPAFISPLIEMQSIKRLHIEDIDDFAVTIPMRKITIGHLSKIASALPGMSLIISQTLSRWDRDRSIQHRDIKGGQGRDEYHLRSFTDLSEYIAHFQGVAASIGLNNVPSSALAELYEKTGGNLATTMLHLCHPLYLHQWVSESRSFI